MKIEKMENGLKLLCDCGLLHEVTLNENEELISNSIYTKNKGSNKNGKTKEETDEPGTDEPGTDEPGTDEPKHRTSFFDLF